MRSVRLREWQTRDPSTEPALRCGPVDSQTRARIRATNSTGRLEVVEVSGGLRVSTSSFVGAVDLGPVVLHIEPKIQPELAPTMMRYALGLDAVKLSSTLDMPVDRMSFTDLVAILLIEEIDRVRQAGLFRDYRAKFAWLGSPKGRLDFAKLASHPMLNRLALPCRYDARTANLALNQTLLASVMALRPAVSEHELQFELHAREALLRECCAALPLSPDLLAAARRQLDRRTAYYEPLLALAELILSARGPAFVADGGASSAALPGFLFDMNELFERFVARLCREHAPRHLRVEAQASSTHAFRYLANPHQWQLPRLRPDIVIYAGREPRLVIDTKYKDLAETRLNASDLYQLTLYSLSFGRDSFVPARLVFPAWGAVEIEPALEFRGMRGGVALARVTVFGLEMENCLEAVRNANRTQLTKVVATMAQPKPFTTMNGSSQSITGP